MCTCTDHSRRVILLTGACQTNGSRHHVQDFDVAIRTLNRTTLITRRTWHRCNRQRLTLSVFVVRKFRTDSVFIVQDTRETNTSLDLTTARTLTQIETNNTSSTWQEAPPLDTRKPAIKTNIGGWCRYTVLDDHKSFVEGRSREVLVASKRTTSDFYGKRTHFSLDKVAC